LEKLWGRKKASDGEETNKDWKGFNMKDWKRTKKQRWEGRKIGVYSGWDRRSEERTKARTTGKTRWGSKRNQIAGKEGLKEMKREGKEDQKGTTMGGKKYWKSMTDWRKWRLEEETNGKKKERIMMKDGMRGEAKADNTLEERKTEDVG
jgi:hypothetical protein